MTWTSRTKRSSSNSRNAGQRDDRDGERHGHHHRRRRHRPSLSISSPSVAEGDSGQTATLAYEVTLSAGQCADRHGVVCGHRHRHGDGERDYTALNPGTLTFNPGDQSQTISVTVRGDDLDEPNETVIVELSNAANATIGTASGTGHHHRRRRSPRRSPSVRRRWQKATAGRHGHAGLRGDTQCGERPDRHGVVCGHRHRHGDGERGLRPLSTAGTLTFASGRRPEPDDQRHRQGR